MGRTVRKPSAAKGEGKRKPAKPRKPKPAKPPVELVPAVPPNASPRLRRMLERLFAGSAGGVRSVRVAPSTD
jgi:hypothetical protein